MIRHPSDSRSGRRRSAATGVIDAEETDGAGNAYMTIAREIAAYDDRNYPGIPPANPTPTIAGRGLGLLRVAVAFTEL